MSSVGSITLLKLSGPQVPSLASAVEIIDRDGVDSVADRVNALKAESVTIYTTEGVSTLVSAQSAADDYSALKGTKVTVVDDMGRSTENVIVIDVRVTRIQQVLNATGSVNYLIYAVWMLKPTEE